MCVYAQSVCARVLCGGWPVINWSMLLHFGGVSTLPTRPMAPWTPFLFTLNVQYVFTAIVALLSGCVFLWSRPLQTSRHSPPENMVKSVKILSARPRGWRECVALARVKFEKYYNHKVGVSVVAMGVSLANNWMFMSC